MITTRSPSRASLATVATISLTDPIWRARRPAAGKAGDEGARGVRVAERARERDHLTDVLGPAARELARVDAPEAPADERDAPAVARASFISVQGGAIVLGRTQAATVTIGVEEPPGTEDRPLRLSVNVGAFSEPVRIGPGKFKATYVPPPERYPQVALVAVWKETGPDARIDFIKFPLFGTTRVPVVSRNAVEVRAKIGFDSFGPVPADRKGRALIPVTVPPDFLHSL